MSLTEQIATLSAEDRAKLKALLGGLMLVLTLHGCAVPTILQPGGQIEQDVRIIAGTTCAFLEPSQQDDAREVIAQVRLYSDLALYDYMSNPTPTTRTQAAFQLAWYLARRTVDLEAIDDVEAWKAAIGHQLRVALDACGASLGTLA